MNIPKPIPTIEKKILAKINEISFLGDYKSIKYLHSPWGTSCLMFALQHYKDRSLKLTEKEWDYLIENSNISSTDYNYKDALMWAAECNGPLQQNINLTANQWDYLIKNSNLKRVCQNQNSLMRILIHHKKYKTKLYPQSFSYLIENSNLLKIDKELSLSVLGLIITKKPSLINKTFSKVIANPKFNINNYKNDKVYKQIKGNIINIEIKTIKDNINKSIPNNDNKKSLKI